MERWAGGGEEEINTCFLGNRRDLPQFTVNNLDLLFFFFFKFKESQVMHKRVPIFLISTFPSQICFYFVLKFHL